MNLRLRLGCSIALAALAACLADPVGVESPPPAELVVAGLVVSDPAPAGADTAPQGLARSSPSESDSVVYVSLAPETTPAGITATIRAVVSRATVTTPVEDGGFDPVTVAAQTGDTIEVVVRDESGTIVLQTRIAVARVRPPIVVRTDPPPKKRDVPLNSVMIVVFSEPIDPATLSSTTVYLSEGPASVTGRLEFTDEARLTAALVPDAPLTSGTDYQLVVTTGIEDLDGDSLEAMVETEFTTVPPVASVDVSPGAATVVMGDSVQLTAVPRDTAANPLSDRPITWGSSDSGVASVTPAGLVRAAQVGAAFIVASAEGKADTAAITVAPVGPPGSMEIAFVANGDIYVMDADGSNITQLTNDAATDGDPAWSPDGSQIAFMRWFSRDAFYIYVIGADGSGLRRLTNNGMDWEPTWSPDGTRLAFVSGPGRDLHVINADGSLPRKIYGQLADVFGPAWSPDGTAIALTTLWGTSGTGDSSAVLVVKLDGSAVARLTSSDGHSVRDWHPVWSPDGRQIAFVRQNISNEPFWSTTYSLHVMDQDGAGLARLADAPFASSPTWSPDCGRIAFSANGSINLMNANGSQLTRLGDGSDPAWWSPAAACTPGSVVGAAVFTVQPTDVTAGATITPAVQVTIRDALGNTNAAFNGAVTVQLGAGRGATTLDGTTTVAAVNGIAVFGDLRINRAGAAYALRAYADNLAATSAAFNVAPGAATSLTFTAPPAGTLPRAILSPPVQITARDAFGNTDTAFAGIVTLALATNPGSGFLWGSTMIPAVKGVATFHDLSIDAIGIGYTLRATAGGLNSAVSTAFDIIASPGRMAFLSDRDGNDGIFVMSEEGLTRLTSEPVPADGLTWSLDGTRIAFSYHVGTDYAVYVINSDGSGRARLTSSGMDGDPAWSPDGQQIAFVSARNSGERDLYVMSADGTGQRKLVNDPTFGTDVYSPAWSPDGRKIAFAINTGFTLGEGGSVRVAQADGTGVTRLTPSGTFEWIACVAWSPDGSKIAIGGAYTSGAISPGLYIMNADGSGLRLLIGTNPPYTGDCAWSPDGSKIAFTGTGDGGVGAGSAEIHVINVDGSGSTRLTNHPASDRSPAWSPVP